MWIVLIENMQELEFQSPTKIKDVSKITHSKKYKFQIIDFDLLDLREIPLQCCIIISPAALKPKL